MVNETSRASSVPMAPGHRVSHSNITRGLLKFFERHPSKHGCESCGLIMPRYPGRYPSKCPLCGGAVARREAGGAAVGSPEIGPHTGAAGAVDAYESVVSGVPVVAVSRVPRLQAIIEAAVEGETPAPIGPKCSTPRFISFEIVERLIPGGVEGLRLFLEGPIAENENRYFRVEGREAAILIFEFRPQASALLIYATDDPASSIGFDPRADLIEGGGKIRPGEGPQGGDGATRAVGGFRFEISAGRRAKARKDLRQAVQNKINARRGLASRIAAAKKWHQGREGDRYHSDLGRYNKGNHRGNNVAKLSEDTDQNRSVDDLFDALLRKLIALEDLDIVQDVNFTDDGAVYFYIDPTIEYEEIEAILNAFRQENGHVELVGSPSGKLPGETGPADWWVIFVSSDAAAGARRTADQGSGETGSPAPEPSYVKADSGLAHIANQVDVGKLIQAVANESRSGNVPSFAFWSSSEDRAPRFAGISSAPKLPSLCEAAARGEGTLFLIFAPDAATARDTMRKGRLRAASMNVLTNVDDPRAMSLIRAMGVTTV